MPLVFLKYPIVKHYAGSVFDLEEGFNLDEHHPLSDERLPPKRFFILPDDGKGRNLNLSFSDIDWCPSEIFKEIDLSSGPGRITSVISDTGENLLYNWTDSELLNLKDSDDRVKQIIQIRWPEEMERPVNGIFFDRKKNIQLGESKLTNPHFEFDLRNLHPGFFEIRVQLKEKIIFRITFIKCFPLVVSRDDSGGGYQVQRAIW